MVRPLLLCALLIGLVACHRSGTAAGSGMAPASTLSQLQARYEGRNVWMYGGGPLWCTRGTSRVELRGSIGDPLRVVDLRQLVGRAPVKQTRGGVVPAEPVARPYELVLRPGPSFKPVSGGGSSERDLQALMAAGCPEVRVLYADADHIGRELSVRPPASAMLRLWNQPTDTPVGLSHLQALWIRGAPDRPLTSLNALLRAPIWTTYGPPGYGDWTLSFRGDRVVAETAPDPMP